VLHRAARSLELARLNDAGGKTALVDWELIALNDRTVYVAFDSDVMEKVEVHSALVRLKAFLESHKATVKLLYLSVGEYGEKPGWMTLSRNKAGWRNDMEIRDALLALATNELRKPRPPRVSTADPKYSFCLAICRRSSTQLNGYDPECAALSYL